MLRGGACGSRDTDGGGQRAAHGHGNGEGPPVVTATHDPPKWVLNETKARLLMTTSRTS